MLVYYCCTSPTAITQIPHGMQHCRASTLGCSGPPLYLLTYTLLSRLKKNVGTWPAWCPQSIPFLLEEKKKNQMIDRRWYGEGWGGGGGGGVSPKTDGDSPPLKDWLKQKRWMHFCLCRVMETIWSCLIIIWLICAHFLWFLTVPFLSVGLANFCGDSNSVCILKSFVCNCIL
jgi:hypothetical protein